MTKTVKPDLQARVAKMVEAFEGGWLAGDFDGMVLSWGPFQWNIGQGTLQPLMRRLVELGALAVQQHLGTEIIAAIKANKLESFARANILTPAGHARVEWQRSFARLAQEAVTQRVFMEFMQPWITNGQRLCEALEFETERAYALCVDVSVQNGAPRRDHIQEFKARLSRGEYRPGVPLLKPGRPEEWERLKVLANVVADSANPRWHANVLARKTAIAVGAGTVHGKAYILERDFGIRYWADADAGIVARWFE